jgi:hypothetical protein
MRARSNGQNLRVHLDTTMSRRQHKLPQDLLQRAEHGKMGLLDSLSTDLQYHKCRHHR